MKVTGRIHRVGFLVFALLIFCAATGWSQGYERRVEVSWDFTTATSTLGWYTNEPLSGFGLSNGALIFPATEGWQCLFSPRISVLASPMQVMEVVMSSETTGHAQLLWAKDLLGDWRGSELTIVADGSFHHYYLPIDTSSATTIYGLRVAVLPAGGTVAIKSVARVTLVPSAGPPVSPVWEFDTDGDFKGWIPYPYAGVIDWTISGGRLRIKTYTDTTLLSPLAAIPNQMEWFSAFGKVERTTLESPFLLFNLVNQMNNAASPKVCVDLVPDGADHVYNLNFGWTIDQWPTVSSLSITLSENTTFAIERIQISEAPHGRADVFVDALAPTSLVRAGTPFQFSCRVSDRGAEPLEQLSVQLALPDDGSIRVISSPSVPTTVQNGYPQTLTWTLVASRPGPAPISVTASAHVGGTSSASANILVNPAITPAKASYVPPPRPVSSGYDLGVYYMPAWALDSHWDPIRNDPERMPVLGNYAEGSPQVIDWQIKWAVEHGIKFFIADTGWGPPDAMGHARGEWRNNFFKAYFASRYRSYIQFCIQYADVFDSLSIDEFLAIVKEWIEKYLTQPEYYKINGMPVVITYNPWKLDTCLGGSSKQAFDAARQLAKDAGLGGIYFIATANGSGSDAPELVKWGYDALCHYTLGGVGASSPDESSYSLAVSAIQNLWDSYIASSPIPYLMLASSGWDSRPLRVYGYPGTVVETGSTASLYRQLLHAAKSRIDSGKTPPSF